MTTWIGTYQRLLYQKLLLWEPQWYGIGIFLFISSNLDVCEAGGLLGEAGFDERGRILIKKRIIQNIESLSADTYPSLTSRVYIYRSVELSLNFTNCIRLAKSLDNYLLFTSIAMTTTPTKQSNFSLFCCPIQLCIHSTRTPRQSPSEAPLIGASQSAANVTSIQPQEQQQVAILRVQATEVEAVRGPGPRVEME